MSNIQHNLDIQLYSLDELLNLFDLNYDFNIDQLKNAKKKVLSLHPDKSRLPSEYFIFYKKAFEIIYNLYEERIKQSKIVPKEKMVYDSKNDESAKHTINNVMKNMSNNDFQKKFNDLFEQNMTTKQDTSKNQWFREETPLYNETIKNGSISNTMQSMKQNSVMLYQGIQNLSTHNNNNLYQDNESKYVSSDVFSKLKYDDLRRVHKDETIFSVGEHNLQDMKLYNNAEELKHARSGQNITPMEQKNAEKMIYDMQRNQDLYIKQKQYEHTQKSLINEKKNNEVLANFLRLQF